MNASNAISQIENTFGIEACIAETESRYQAAYISSPKMIKELMAEWGQTMEEVITEVDPSGRMNLKLRSTVCAIVNYDGEEIGGWHYRFDAQDALSEFNQSKDEAQNEADWYAFDNEPEDEDEDEIIVQKESISDEDFASLMKAAFAAK